MTAVLGGGGPYPWEEDCFTGWQHLGKADTRGVGCDTKPCLCACAGSAGVVSSC